MKNTTQPITRRALVGFTAAAAATLFLAAPAMAARPTLRYQSEVDVKGDVPKSVERVS